MTLSELILPEEGEVFEFSYYGELYNIEPAKVVNGWVELYKLVQVSTQLSGFYNPDIDNLEDVINTLVL